MGMLRSCCLLCGIWVAGDAWAAECQLKNFGTLPVEMIGARATTLVKLNGTDTRLILDTGAFFNIMSAANANALKLSTRRAPLDFELVGVGGTADAEFATVKEFGMLGTTFHKIDFIVGGSDMGTGLLGANLLDLVDLDIDLAGGKVALVKAEKCDDGAQAYWVKVGEEYQVADLDQHNNPRDRRTFFRVMINGKKVRALLDSGAYTTVITRNAAERVGIDLNAPGVKVGGRASGVGAEIRKTWVAPIDSFSIGTETIRNSRIQVLDGSLGGDTDMLLGVDFLLAHHIFVANNVEKAYFTYNGGRVFSLDEASSGGAKSDVAATDNPGTPPTTASEYALRGQAHLSRGEAIAAIADLDAAIRMAPEQATYYVARARAHAAAKQGDAAFADVDKAVSLDPRNADTVLMRAEWRLGRKDREGAMADVTTAGSLVSAGSSQAFALANLYLQLDQPAAALPVLDAWIRLHDDDASLGSALNKRCWARSLSNQMLDDALSDCRKAIRRDGENPSYLDSLGMVELRLGRYPESIKAYEQSITGNPRSVWSHYGLGLAKIRDGQTDAGKAELSAAHALDPQIERHAALYGLTAPGP